MNEMAMVEYLLRQYAEYSAKTEKARKKNDDFEYAYYDGKAEMARHHQRAFRHDNPRDRYRVHSRKQRVQRESEKGVEK